MEKDDDLKVVITRASVNSSSAIININDISGIKWDSISGGVHQKAGHYCLYGYIPYKLAKTCNIDCSGMHDWDNNTAKICIQQGANSNPKYQKGYNTLCSLAGEKPQSIISQNRPKNQPPCTYKILNLLENGTYTRSEIRAELLELGYKSGTILGAIRSLHRQNKILLCGSSNSPKQEIKLSNAKS
ncbi:MAG: hypothetical protein ACRDBO_16485 [Lachnospiraceae bacterium]